MPSKISLMNENLRDAEVFAVPPASPPAPRFVNENGEPVKTRRFVSMTEECSYPSLLRKYGSYDLLAEALCEGDPELSLNTGRRLGETSRVWVRSDGTLLHATNFLKVVKDPKGEELKREPFVEVSASVDEEHPLVWTGKLFPKEKVFSRFVLSRALQLRHVNGLTYDFLFEISRTLHEQGRMLFVTSSEKGPLILQRNGKPYRGFLEGRIQGNQYRLVLFLSNLELTT